MTEFFQDEPELILDYETSGSSKVEAASSSPVPSGSSSRATTTTPSPKSSSSNSLYDRGSDSGNSFDESD